MSIKHRHGYVCVCVCSLVKEENLQREIVDLNIKLEELKASYDQDVNKVWHVGLTVYFYAIKFLLYFLYQAKAELSREKQRMHQAHEKELRQELVANRHFQCCNQPAIYSIGSCNSHMTIT